MPSLLLTSHKIIKQIEDQLEIIIELVKIKEDTVNGDNKSLVRDQDETSNQDSKTTKI